MNDYYGNLQIEDLKTLLIAQGSRFTKGIDSGLSFDALKELRVKFREIEAEIKRREPDR